MSYIFEKLFNNILVPVLEFILPLIAGITLFISSTFISSIAFIVAGFVILVINAKNSDKETSINKTISFGFLGIGLILIGFIIGNFNINYPIVYDQFNSFREMIENLSKLK